LTWKPTPPKGYPTDYFVPNFGVDHEIVATHKHMGDAEKRLKHKWVLKKDEDDKWVVPTEEAFWRLRPEDRHFDFVQTDAEIEREPLLTWKPKDPKSHPVDYFVPNFGVDHEIVATHKHMGDAEKRLKHKWVPKKDEDDKWVVPTEETFFHIRESDRHFDM
jgi:hypothetical protein